MGDMFGKKRLLLIVLGLYVAGSTTCVLSPSIGVLVAGRLVMGAGGAVLPLSYAITRDEVPRRYFPTGVGLISASLGVGSAVGLVVGGAILDHLSFRWVFGVCLIGGALIATLVAALIPESPVRTPARLDLVGALLLSIGLAVPFVGVTRGSVVGWMSPQTLGSIAIGVVILVVFAAYELRQPMPIFHVPTFLMPRVLWTNLSSMVSGFAFAGATFALVLQYLQLPSETGFGFGKSATFAGVVLLPACVAMLVASSMIGRMIALIGPKRTLLAGTLASTIGLWLIVVDHSNLYRFGLWMAIEFAGLGVLQAATPVLVLQEVPASRSGEAAGVNTILRYAGAALGTQVGASVVTASASHQPGGFPTEHGYTMAFAVLAVSGMAAFLLGLKIPRSARGIVATARQEPSVASVGSPSDVPDPGISPLPVGVPPTGNGPAPGGAQGGATSETPVPGRWSPGTVE
jgi:MFS family permease